MSQRDDRATATGDGASDVGPSQEVRALAEAVVEAVNRGRSAGGRSAIDAVEGAARRLVQRVVDGAVADPRPVGDRRRLERALRQRSRGSALGGTTAVAMASRVGRRLGPARFLARRTPLWFAVTALPAVYGSISRGADELALVSSHLVLRARRDGVEPDPQRLRRVAVQVVTGRAVEPESEPSLGPLAFSWARRAARAAIPFASGVKTRDPDGMASAAADVDIAALSAR